MSPEYDFKEAVRELRQSGIDVADRAYGFSIFGEDGAGKMKADCGVDNDGSVSMSVTSDGAPVAWFFRLSAAGIAGLIISASRRLSDKKSDRWVEALKAADGG